MSARVEAFLGLDISRFQSGLDKANGVMARFKSGLKMGGLGAFGGLLGAGALIAALRGTIGHAQELRDKARLVGREVDGWTAAAARFADTLGEIKTGALGLGAKGIGGLASIGEGVGVQFGLLLEQLGLRKPGQTMLGEMAQMDADAATASRDRARANIPEGFMRGHNRTMRGLNREEQMIGADERGQLAELARQAKELRADAAKLTRPEDFTERKKLEQEARRLEVDGAKKAYELRESQRKAREKEFDFIRQSSVKEETTAQKIVRLKKEADREQDRSLDTTRSLAERDEHRMRMLQLAAEAAKTEYQWKNKPLTVAEAAARTPSGRRNTTSVGVMGRNIERFRSAADRARAMGRYGEAAQWDARTRSEEEKFEAFDRAGRDAAAGRADEDKRTPWERRWGAQLRERRDAIDRGNAERRRRIQARYGGAFDRPDSFEKSNIEKSADNALKQAAEDLKAAAAELKNVEVEVTGT